MSKTDKAQEQIEQGTARFQQLQVAQTEAANAAKKTVSLIGDIMSLMLSLVLA